MPKIIFRKNEQDSTVDAEVGDTLLEVAKKNDIDLFGGCDGAGLCGTCNVAIDESFLSKLEPPCGNELDLLDIVSCGRDNIRLACQVIVTENMDGMIVNIP